MVIKLRVKRPDAILRQIINALREYEDAHPQAEIEAYRQNSDRCDSPALAVGRSRCGTP